MPYATLKGAANQKYLYDYPSHPCALRCVALRRFPKWMWKNEVMPPFIQFLREHNNRVMKTTGDAYNKVSFYGMDLYSLHRSAQAVIQYLERIDPEGAKKARKK